MFDLGRTIFASAERNAQALAIVDGEVRLTYGDWAELIGRVAGGLRALGLEPGDHVATVLQNRWQMATIHWACQVARLIATPLNWRFSPDELDYCLADAEARAVVFEDASAAAVAGSETARTILRIALDDHPGAEHTFETLCAAGAAMAPPHRNTTPPPYWHIPSSGHSGQFGVLRHSALPWRTSNSCYSA